MVSLMEALLSKDHTILERRIMEFRPFGVDARGNKIRDASGVTVLANVECLEELVSEMSGPDAGAKAVEELCIRLNERISDRAYHVTPQFLKNVWNSYSYEFVCFLGQICVDISGDPDFQFCVGKRKLISPIIQTLGRPFSVSQIYRMFPHFGQKYAKGSIHFSTGVVTERSAILRMQYAEHVLQQFGPYRKSCAHLICQSSKAALGAFPQLIHRLNPATIIDRLCVAEGDECCEWEFTWAPTESMGFVRTVTGTAIALVTFAFLRYGFPDMSLPGSAVLSLFPGMTLWLAFTARALRGKVLDRERVLQEQVTLADTRHEELRESYLELEHAAVELKRRLGQLTLLHQTGIIVNSTLDRETLLQTSLQAIRHALHYDRVLLSFYDAARQVFRDARLIGVGEEVASLARTLETPATDPVSVEGQIAQGHPVLIKDIRQAWERLHPLSQQLASITHAKSIISVPLKVKDRVIGALTVDRLQSDVLNEEDLDVMVTVANQLAIALEHASAYQEVEELNAGLEQKVRERTMQLEKANEQLQELNQLKSSFVSVVSHELRTPMTSIRTYVENMLDGVTGDVNEKQAQYLRRIQVNIDRLTRMIVDLLDLSRIESGRVELRQEPISIVDWMNELVEGLQSLATSRSVRIESHIGGTVPTVHADRDKLTQILTNLIGNAIKFTPAGGHIAVEAHADNDNDFLQIRVSDTGCGIPHEELPKVFEKFFRGTTTTAEDRGAGLGLAIVRSLVELQGGRIWVESAVGKGSSFYFTLPFHRTQETIG